MIPLARAILAGLVVLFGAMSMSLSTAAQEATSDGVSQEPAQPSSEDLDHSRAVGPEETPPVDPRFAALHQQVEAAREEWQAGGAGLLLLTREGIVDEAYFGRYRPASTVPLTSASQWLAAAAILTLVDDGRLALEGSLSELAPDLGEEIPPRVGQITLRQLLSHTSGLSAQNPCLADAERSLESCAQAILEAGLEDPPGRRVRFGGAAYQVAAFLAERASGQPWENFFQEALAEPLGMTRTTFGGAGNPPIADGARASLRDYGRFLSMLLAGGQVNGRRILTESSLEAMLSNQSGRAQDAYSPFSGGDFGLGVWTADSSTFACPGTFGVVPWIEPEEGRAGLVMTLAPSSQAWPMAEQIQQAFRELSSAEEPPANPP